MYVKELLKHINPHNLIEIVDVDFRRIYYGCMVEMDNFTWNLLTSLKTAEINSFLAETEQGIFEPAVQIRIGTEL